jgi:HPr kinase/phosphorylase
MESHFISLSELMDVLKDNIEIVFLPTNYDETNIYSADVNRPGLLLVGFSDYFDNNRIQVLGKVEHTYLGAMTPEDKYVSLKRLFSTGIPAVFVTRDLSISSEAIELAQKYNVPLFRTKERTSRFMADLIMYLNNRLAQRITRHGVLVEVHGEGILLLGGSGVGKSETAIELVKRGHSLIADDAVEIKRLSDTTLVGSAPETIRHYMELRGIGIVDIKNIFGIGAVKDSEVIDLVIQMEVWDDRKNYDRLGMDMEYMHIMDVAVPTMVLPVKPGRNLAVIIEVAAMNNKQKKLGYNAANALNERLINNMNKQLK